MLTRHFSGCKLLARLSRSLPSEQPTGSLHSDNMVESQFLLRLEVARLQWARVFARREVDLTRSPQPINITEMIPSHMYHFYLALQHFILPILMCSDKWRQAVVGGASINHRDLAAHFCMLLLSSVRRVCIDNNCKSQWGLSLVTADGDVWRKHRRIMGPAFNNKLCVLRIMCIQPSTSHSWFCQDMRQYGEKPWRCTTKWWPMKGGLRKNALMFLRYRAWRSKWVHALRQC